jgi:hypothetical protein
MISEANQKAIEAAGLSFILGMKIPDVPTRWTSGAGSTRARTSPAGTSSPSPGPLGPARSAVTSGSSIEAHLTIVFAALAVSRWIEAQTGWSIRKFVKKARRYRTIGIQAGRQTITAADPLPDDLRRALETITRGSRGAH